MKGHVNKTTLFQNIPNIEPELSELKNINKLLEKGDFKELAWSLLRLVYLGDLINTKLFLSGLVSKDPKDKQKIYTFNRLASIFMDVIKIQLFKISKKTTEKEAKQVLEEFDTQIKRVTDFFNAERG